MRSGRRQLAHTVELRGRRHARDVQPRLRRQRLLRWLAVGFEADNFTGTTRVRDLLDFPLPGRSFIGSVTARF